MKGVTIGANCQSFLLRVDKRLMCSLLVFMRNYTVMTILDCLHNQITYSSDTHTYPTRHATTGLFTVPKSQTNSRQSTVLYRVTVAWKSHLQLLMQTAK
jgi:hypothetical protein